MIVQLYASSFRMRDDTESCLETPGAIKFMEDHGVPFTKFCNPASTMSGVNFPAENRLQWHESMANVEIACSTVKDVLDYCEKYNATVTFISDNVLIEFL